MQLRLPIEGGSWRFSRKTVRGSEWPISVSPYQLTILLTIREIFWKMVSDYRLAFLEGLLVAPLPHGSLTGMSHLLADNRSPHST